MVEFDVGRWQYKGHRDRRDTILRDVAAALRRLKSTAADPARGALFQGVAVGPAAGRALTRLYRSRTIVTFLRLMWVSLGG